MPELTKCKECGKLFAPHAGKDRCSDCLAQQESVQARIEAALRHVQKPTLNAVVEFTGFAEHVVRRAVERSRVLRAQIDMDEPCARCGVRGAQAGSDFCFPCRMALYGELGDAVEVIAPRAHATADERVSRDPTLGLGRAIEEKRARTRSARINLGPDTRIRP